MHVALLKEIIKKPHNVYQRINKHVSAALTIRFCTKNVKFNFVYSTKITYQIYMWNNASNVFVTNDLLVISE